MAPAQVRLELRVPLPALLPPDFAVAALQTYELLMRFNPHLRRYERAAVDLASVVDDAFFTADGRRLVAFDVHQSIPIIPGIVAKDLVVPAVFQSFDRGARCRADAAAGVRVWGSYEIRRAPAGAGPASGPASGWELAETVVVQCGKLVRGFVAKSVESAHRENCEKVVEEMTREFARQQAADSQLPLPPVEPKSLRADMPKPRSQKNSSDFT